MAVHVVGVRHHSPACARLVEETIRRTRPKYVLVEGPSDMNERLSELALAHELPIALFTYRQDPDGRSRGSWAPFCAYSPEWVALRAATEVGATPLFVDLPAWDPSFDAEGMENRYSDRHVRHSERLGEICARLGLEDTDSLWDHLFEQPSDIDALAARLDAYFAALRADEAAGARDGPREDYMARHVAWAARDADGRDVVLVCGGYHKPAIETLWPRVPAERPSATVPAGSRIGSYLVPFSFLRLSSFAGYASGMPSPGFYQAVWEEGHERAAGEMLFRAIRALRARGQRVLAADAISASTLAHGLRALRGHAAMARVDVLDGLAGALVKDSLEAPLPWTRRGALSAATDPMLTEIVAAFTGDRIGTLARDTPRPPLVQDAFAELDRVGVALARDPRRFRVQLTVGSGAEISGVLHRLRLLDIPGFSLVRGPTLARTNTDLSEEWSVAHRLESDTALIEASLYGATLETATAAKLEERGRQARDVGTLADVLMGAALARIRSLTTRALADIARVVGTEASFAALGKALAMLLALRRGELVLGTHGQAELSPVIAACFDRGLWLYEGLQGPTAPLDENQVRAVVALRDAVRTDLAVDRDRARGVCERRVRDAAAPPGLRGAALGMLWSTRHRDVVEDAATAAHAVATLRGAAHHTTFGDFLAGLFALAREEVIRAPGLLATIDAVVTGFPREDFLMALPALRQAFAYFTPRERLGIAERVLASGNAGPGAVDPMQLVGAAVDVEGFRRGAALDRRAARMASRFGLADDRAGASPGKDEEA